MAKDINFPIQNVVQPQNSFEKLFDSKNTVGPGFSIRPLIFINVYPFF